MQLKTVGESLTALNSITLVLNTTSAGTEAQQLALMAIGEKYNVTILKQAISQSLLNKEQIEAILVGSTLEASLLETTTAELAQITATNGLTASQKGATASTLGFGTAVKGLAAKIRDLGVSFASVSLSNPILLGLEALVVLCTSVALAYQNYKKNQEEIIEKGKEAESNISELNSTFNSHKETVESATETYRDLRNAIDDVSNAKLYLNTDDYNKWLETNHQLADAFPSLIKGIDEEGNYILDLGNSAEEATKKLNGLIEAEQVASAKQIKSDLTDTFSGYYNQDMLDIREIRDNYYDNSAEDILTSAYIIPSDMAKKTTLSLNMNFLEGFDSEDFLNRASAIINEKFGSDLNVEYNDLTSEYFVNFSEMTEKEAESAIQYLYENLNLFDDAYADALEQERNSINANYQKNLGNIFTVLKYTDEDYSGLTDNGKSIADALISGLNYYDYRDIIEKNYSGDIIKFIQEELLDNLYKLSDEEKAEVDKIYANLLSINPDDSLSENVNKIEEYINQLCNLLGIEDVDGRHQLMISLGFDIQKDKDLLNRAKTIGTGHTNGQLNANRESDSEVQRVRGINEYLNSLDESELTLLVDSDEFSMIQTQKEIEDLLEKLKSEAKITVETDLSSYLSNNPKLEQSLIQLSKTGKLDKEAINSFKEYDEMLALCSGDADKLIDELDEIANQSSGSLDATNNLTTITGGLDSLSEVYSQAMEDGFVQSDAITKLYDQFGDLSVFDSFVEAMQNIGDANYDTAQSFNDLANAYIDTNLPLNDLTEATKQQYIQELQNNGVTNAKEAIEQRLAYVTGIREQALASLASTQEYANLTTEDLANATISEINSMIDSANAAGMDTSALNTLAMMKAKVSANQITESTSISEILSVAKACGITTPQLSMYNYMKDHITGAPSSALDTIANNAKQSVLNAINNFDFGFEKYQYSGVGKYSSTSGSGTSPASEAKDTTKQYNWIETAINRVQEALSRLTKVRDNTYAGWTKRNTALNSEIAKITEEINLQQQAFNNYLSQADSIGLSQDYRNKIQNGTIQIENIQDEGLQDKIDQYQDWYNKAVECQNAIQDLNMDLSKLAEQKFDNIQTEFDSFISTITAQTDVIHERVNRTEEQGYFADKIYYNQLKLYKTQEAANLQQEFTALQNSFREAVATGKIEEGSEAWSDMKAEILSVEQAIEESNTAIVEYNNSIRDLDWDIFDHINDRIGQITEESEFLIDLLEHSNLYDENGAFNAEGKAVTALHGVNYNIYMQQSLDYAKELKKIEADLAKDQNNRDLIDRREELLNLQQDAIKNAEAEKSAIRSLVEDGIDLHLDALSELIEKYKESLNAAKDLYDYQTNISEQTENIANLEKILMAYQDDDSEETRQKIQDTKNQLEEARQELRETEWDKYIAETEDLLDTLYEDYETILNERLDNMDALIADMIQMVNTSGSEIRDAVNETAARVGYDITNTLNTIFGDGGKQVTLISNFMNKFDTASTTLQTAINDIKNSIHSMMTTPAIPASAGGTNNGGSSSGATSSGGVSSGSTASVHQTQSAAPSTQGDNIAAVGDLVTFINGKYHEDSWGNGRSGSQNLNGQVYITKIKAGSPYPYHISRGSTLGNGDLGWVKLDQLRGYQSGSKKINKTQLAFMNEAGAEIRYRSGDGAMMVPLGEDDMVFTHEMSQRLWNIAKGTSPITAEHDMTMPNISQSLYRNPEVINNSNDITITLPNVTNYTEFKNELQKDNTFAGFVREITLGESLGGNSLNKNRYI